MTDVLAERSESGTRGSSGGRPPRLGWVLGLTSTAYFMVVLDALVVITALPRMQASLGVGLATIQWTVNAYGIAFAAGIITAAAVGDRLGRRKVFVTGVVLFTLASAACALAPDASALIVARTLQGLGGAIVLPLSLTILTAAFPIERRGMIVGIYGGLAGLAVACGPLVGGAVTEGIDWHWIFWINVPIGVAASLLSRRLLPESYGPPARLDLIGVALVSAGSVSLVWGFVRAGAAGWASAEIVTTLALGVLSLLGFVVWESRTREPMMPLRLFRVRTFSAANATGFLMMGSIFAAAVFVTQYFQLVLGNSPLESGLKLLPWTATPMIVSPLAGAISDRIGRRPVMATGLLLQAAGFTWVALKASVGASYPEIVVALLVAGVGISMALPTVPTAVLSSVEPGELGTAAGITNMLQRLGAVVAVAICSAVFAAYGQTGSAAGIVDGFKPALAVSIALSLLGALTALATGPGPEAVPELAPIQAAP